MNRRRFLKLSALAGVSVFTPIASRDAFSNATFSPYEGPYWLMINCVGGWDPTLLCDPKGRELSVKSGLPVNTAYSQAERMNLAESGAPIWFAPEVRPRDTSPATTYSGFMAEHKQRALIINGVDAQTNGHVQGERVTWSGHLPPGYPSLAALIAAAKSAQHELPIPFLTFGGYDATGDLITPTRLRNITLFSKVALPDVGGVQGQEQRRFHSTSAQRLIDEAATARHEALMAQTQLPRHSQALNNLYAARLSERNVSRILDVFDITTFQSLSQRDDALRRQGLLALAAFKSGVSFTSNLTLGGWDTHTRNDEFQVNLMHILFESLRDIFAWAQEFDILNKLNVVIASDFGRTPHHNGSQQGKDHWSVGSWITLLNASAPRDTRGLIGGTYDSTLKGYKLSADTLAPLPETSEDPTAVSLTPAHLHRQLRTLAGIAPDHTLARAYPLEVPDLPVFSS